MFALAASLVAIACYLVGAWLQQRRLGQGSGQAHRPAPISLMGWLSHSLALYGLLFVDGGLNLNLSAALSLTAWVVVGIILLNSLRKPSASLLVMALPLAAAAVLLATLGQEGSGRQFSQGLLLHIMTSVLAYSLFAVAACQALLLAFQDGRLKRHQSSRLSRNLPPLQTMESLLFELILAGMVLLTVALLTGWLFVDDLLAQKLAHKTLLSVLAWVIFAVLLWGHYRLGWRGRTAIRFTWLGFAALAVGYFGTKLALEVLLVAP